MGSITPRKSRLGAPGAARYIRATLSPGCTHSGTFPTQIGGKKGGAVGLGGSSPCPSRDMGEATGVLLEMEECGKMGGGERN